LINFGNTSTKRENYITQKYSENNDKTTFVLRILDFIKLSLNKDLIPLSRVLIDNLIETFLTFRTRIISLYADRPLGRLPKVLNVIYIYIHSFNED
jgi:hypothetical protein